MTGLNTYLILIEHEVNIGNISRVKDLGEDEVFYEALFPILTKYEDAILDLSRQRVGISNSRTITS